MKKAKRERLEGAGWRVGNAEDFLELSEADSALIEVRLNLANTLRERRLSKHLSQAALASRIGSSQSRVAKMEAGDPSVTLDLLVRSLLAFGSTGKEIASAFTASTQRGAARKSA